VIDAFTAEWNAPTSRRRKGRSIKRFVYLGWLCTIGAIDDRLYRRDTARMSTGEHYVAGLDRSDADDPLGLSPPPDSGLYKDPRLEWVLALSTGLAAATIVRFGIGGLVPGYLVMSTAIVVAFQRRFVNRAITIGFIVSVGLCLSLWGALLMSWVD
jgi:hypothetical protein